MFDRVDLLFDINKLRNKTILVLGLGGVGSFTVETLCRLPIKKIILVDNDVVEITNLNRQLYTTDDMGCYKVDALESRIKKVYYLCNRTNVCFNTLNLLDALKIEDVEYEEKYLNLLKLFFENKRN